MPASTAKNLTGETQKRSSARTATAWTIIGGVAAILGIIISLLSALQPSWPQGGSPGATPSRTSGTAASPPPSITASPVTPRPTPPALATPPVLGRVEIVVIAGPTASPAEQGADPQGWLTSLGTLLVGVAALLALLRPTQPRNGRDEPAGGPVTPELRASAEVRPRTPQSKQASDAS